MWRRVAPITYRNGYVAHQVHQITGWLSIHCGSEKFEMRHMRSFACLALTMSVAMMCVPGIVRAGDGLPLTRGSLLAVSAFDAVDYVLEYSPSGQLLGMLELVDPDGSIGTPSGVAVAGGQLWIAGRDHVARVDSETGVVLGAFAVSDAPNLVGLAESGNSLLVAEIHPDRVHRYGFDGGLMDTIELLGDPLLITGVDTDGLNLYVATHTTGDVHVFGFDGVQRDRISIGFVGDLTGLTVEPWLREFWVATGTGMNDIHRFDLEGNPLGVFAAGAGGIMGLHVMSSPLFGDGFESGDLQAWQ